MLSEGGTASMNGATTIQERLKDLRLNKGLKLEELGLSFSEYITARRMQKAKELLKDDSRSIEEIANAVGYHDYFYFTKVFKKTQGISPSKYRKSL